MKIKNRFVLFLYLEFLYFIGAIIMGVAGYLMYSEAVGLKLLWGFALLMQPFLLFEFVNRR